MASSHDHLTNWSKNLSLRNLRSTQNRSIHEVPGCELQLPDSYDHKVVNVTAHPH